jgi:hypothetical protein
MDIEGRSGDNLSPRELQGKYIVALEQIAGKSDPESDRHKPIYQSSPMTEQQAVEAAARALSALWKVKRTEKR